METTIIAYIGLGVRVAVKELNLSYYTGENGMSRRSKGSCQSLKPPSPAPFMV